MRFLFTTFLLCLLQISFAQYARVQFIQNATPENVDIYVDGELYVNNFVFRNATPYLEIPAGNVEIQVAPANSTSVADATKLMPTKLEAGLAYVVMVGIVEKGRPDYDLFITDEVNDKADSGSTVGIAFANGSLETGDLDFFWKEFSFSLYDNVRYGEFGPMISLPIGPYDIDITMAEDNEEVFLSHTFDFTWWRGQSLVLFTSGYEDINPKLKTYVALSNGGTFPLSNLPVGGGNTTAYAQLIHNAMAENVDIYVDNKLVKDNFVFRTATPFLELAAKQEITIGIAPKNSTSVQDVYKKFPMRLEADANHVMMLQGDTPDNISLSTYDRGMQESGNNTKVSLLFANGTEDTPTLDFLVDGAILHTDVAYGQYTSYFNFAPTTYSFDVADATGVFKSYEAPFSFWKGGSAVIYTSGKRDGSRPTFKLYVALPNGGTYPLKEIEVDSGIGERGGSFLPNEVYVQTQGNVVDDRLETQLYIPRVANVRADVMDAAGRPVRNYKFGLLEGIHSIEMNTHELSNGMYVIHWKVGREVRVQRIVVARY